jgi:hypothetical protein
MSRRVEISEGPGFGANRASRREMKRRGAAETYALKMSSLDGSRFVVQPFHMKPWKESRDYRALVLRLAREDLRLNAGIQFRIPGAPK